MARRQPRSTRSRWWNPNDLIVVGAGRHVRGALLGRCFEPGRAEGYMTSGVRGRPSRQARAKGCYAMGQSFAQKESALDVLPSSHREASNVRIYLLLGVAKIGQCDFNVQHFVAAACDFRGRRIVKQRLQPETKDCAAAYRSMNRLLVPRAALALIFSCRRCLR